MVCVIYRLISPSGKSYIGLTTKTFEERWKRHLQSYRSALKNGKINKSVALYRAFHKYSPNSFIKEILIECKNEELDQYEIDMIVEYDSFTPNGYNLTRGGRGGITGMVFSEETIINMRTYAEELKGLPKYVQYGTWKHYEYFIIEGHPRCLYKKFQDKLLTLEELKQKVLDFLIDLDLNDKVYVVNHARDLPKNIIFVPKRGYHVIFKEKGKSYWKLFGTQTPNNDILKKATEFRDYALKEGIEKAYQEHLKPPNEYKHISYDKFYQKHLVKIQHKKVMYRERFLTIEEALEYRSELYTDLKIQQKWL